MLFKNKTMENSMEKLEDIHRKIPRTIEKNTKDEGKYKIYLEDTKPN